MRHVESLHRDGWVSPDSKPKTCIASHTKGSRGYREVSVSKEGGGRGITPRSGKGVTNRPGRD